MASLRVTGVGAVALVLDDVHVGTGSARHALLGTAGVNVISAFSIAVVWVPVPARVTVFAFLAHGSLAKLDDGVVAFITIASARV
jgi:hypothetical protein